MAVLSNERGERANDCRPYCILLSNFQTEPNAKRDLLDYARKPLGFGRSRARVQVAQGQTGSQIVALMRSLLGRPRATIQDAANLAGAPDDAVVTASIAALHGQRIIEIVVENPIIRIKVLLYQSADARPVLDDDTVDVTPALQQQGYGTDFLGRQVEQAIRLGIVEIRAYAVRDDRIGDVGYRVWPIFGFDAHLPREIIARLSPELATARKVSDLMKIRKGREWWIKNGDDINLTFDLRPNSPALRRFRAYLRRKDFP